MSRCKVHRGYIMHCWNDSGGSLVSVGKLENCKTVDRWSGEAYSWTPSCAQLVSVTEIFSLRYPIYSFPRGNSNFQLSALIFHFHTHLIYFTQYMHLVHLFSTHTQLMYSTHIPKP